METVNISPSQNGVAETPSQNNGTSAAGISDTDRVSASVEAQPEDSTMNSSNSSNKQKVSSMHISAESEHTKAVAGSSSEDSAEKPENVEKKPVSGDDLYRRSSQYQTWSFGSQELRQKKQHANEKGRAAALKLFASVRSSLEAERPDVFAAHGEKLTSEILELISFDEEQKYLHYFGQQIVQICAHFKMPTQVKATAISFFRKFYLVNSVMEYRPRNILYTAVFLAAKSENYFISIETFCSRIPKTKPEDILGLEFIILSALKFTLLVHHPYRPLYGFFLDFQMILLHPSPAMYDVNVDTIGQLYDKAKIWLNDHALLSDVPFLFTPPQIALAALYDSDKRITDKYLRIKFLNESADTTKTPGSPAQAQHKDQYNLILKTIKGCIRTAKVEMASSKEESTKIDEKCFFALNPQKLLKKRIKALAEPA